MLPLFNPTTCRLDWVNPDYAPLTGEPTGFTTPESVVVTYNVATQSVTLTGTVNGYYRGKKVDALVSGWQSPSHDDIAGFVYFLYYDGSSFVWTTAPMGFDVLWIASVAYRAVDKFCLRECHGLMPWQVHEELHRTIGTYRRSGGEMSSYLPNSTVAADRRPDVAQCLIADEDLVTTNAALSSKSYSQRYIVGPNTITYALAQSDIVPLSGSNPYYNSFTSPNWGQTLMPASSVMSIWLYEVPVAADATSQAYRHVFVQGQWITQAAGPADVQIADAVAIELQRTPAELNLGDSSMIAAEYVAVGRVVIAYRLGNWEIASVNVLTGSRYSQASSASGSFLSSVSVSAPLTGSGTLGSPVAMPAATASVDGYMTKEAMATLNSAAIVGGLDTQIQFNDGGDLAGDAKFTWDKTVSAVKIGDNPTLLPDNPLAIQANVDSYVQTNLQNTSDGTSASSDFIVTADNGDDTTHYFDFGINGSAYSSLDFPILGADDAYIYAPDDNIVIGTAGTGKTVKFHTGGQAVANVSAEVDDDGINLPSGKTYRVDGVDITTTGMTNPMTASGDIIYGGTSGAPTRLPKGSDGEVLKLVSGLPSWEAESALGDGDKGDITVSSSGTVWTIDSSAVTEAKLGFTDVTTANVSTSAHGLCPKLPNNTTTFLRGDGTYAAPGGSTAQEDIIGFVVDGAGSAITTGSKGYREIPYGCTINSWTILGKESGSCVVDVKRCTYSGFPTTSSIAGTEKPTLSSAQKNQDTSLSSWTTSLAAGDILEFVVDSASTVTRITVSLKVTRT